MMLVRLILTWKIFAKKTTASGSLSKFSKKNLVSWRKLLLVDLFFVGGFIFLSSAWCLVATKLFVVKILKIKILCRENFFIAVDFFVDGLFLCQRVLMSVWSRSRMFKLNSCFFSSARKLDRFRSITGLMFNVRLKLMWRILFLSSAEKLFAVKI